MNCRHCGSKLHLPLIDLGSAPPSNAYLTHETLQSPEKWFPLRVLVCTKCWLVQTEDFAGREELFRHDYAYFSSFSGTWLAHAEKYVSNIIELLELNSGSHVVEVAANDGYLLQYVKARNIPCTGIEPTESTATAARSKGLTIIDDFFGSYLARQLAEQGKQADLIVANNVLAHVPDINDFVTGFSILLKPGGTATFEFPHLLQLITESQFDTIYHEHYSYLSLTAVKSILEHNGLTIYNVEKLATHGGSLRIYAQRSDTGIRHLGDNVEYFLKEEASSGMSTPAFYSGLQQKADQIKNAFLSFLLDAKRAGKIVMGYGAAAKGNTILNYSGIRADLIPSVIDRNPAKQGTFLPGSRIPIVEEAQLRLAKPDYVIIFPWNLKNEVTEQLAYIREWGASFVTLIPELEIY